MVTEFPLDILLNIIKLARSTYYYHLKKLNQVDKNQSIKVEIQAIYDEHKGNYGYPLEIDVNTDVGIANLGH